MIYYNESVILDESGFDVVDALMECPIYDKYNSMIDYISEFGYFSESQKIEFRVLEENVFETIGNALKKAWEAIAKFFRGLAGKISGFFKKISMKKIKTAVDKNIKEKEEKMQQEVKQAKQEGRFDNPEEKEKLRKKFAVKVNISEKDNNGNYTNLACLDSRKLVKETINTGGYKKFKQLVIKAQKFMERNTPKGKQAEDERFKSKEAADRFINQLEQEVKVDNSCRTMKIPSSKVREKINECVQINKFSSLISNGDGYLVPKSQQELSDYLFGLSDFSLQENRSMTKLYTDIANLADEAADEYKDMKSAEKSNNGYVNRAFNGILKKHKELLSILNQDKGGLSQITDATLKAYKDAAKLIMKFGSKTQKDALNKDGIDLSDELKNNNESYDPWAGLEESYDPWAGLKESYDPWDDLW